MIAGYSAFTHKTKRSGEGEGLQRNSCITQKEMFRNKIKQQMNRESCMEREHHKGEEKGEKRRMQKDTARLEEA